MGQRDPPETHAPQPTDYIEADFGPRHGWVRAFVDEHRSVWTPNEDEKHHT
jgi:hypothetical protein